MSVSQIGVQVSEKREGEREGREAEGRLRTRWEASSPGTKDSGFEDFSVECHRCHLSLGYCLVDLIVGCFSHFGSVCQG